MAGGKKIAGQDTQLRRRELRKLPGLIIDSGISFHFSTPWPIVSTESLVCGLSATVIAYGPGKPQETTAMNE